jgi:Cu/Zn superoxide dismutase
MIKSPFRPTAPALAAVLALAAAGFASAAKAPATASTLKATLTGAAEKPTPGDPKGSGKVTLYVDSAKLQVCYELQATGIAPATMAHIHQAPPAESGPPLAILQAPGADGKSSGCVEAGPILRMGLIDNPSAYYVNVHNAQYPAGALRGQLHR